MSIFLVENRSDRCLRGEIKLRDAREWLGSEPINDPGGVK